MRSWQKYLLTDAGPGLVLAPCFAGVAQLVEHHLAKVDVESSSLFARSIFEKPLESSPAVFSCLHDMRNRRVETQTEDLPRADARRGSTAFMS